MIGSSLRLTPTVLEEVKRRKDWGYTHARIAVDLDISVGDVELAALRMRSGPAPSPWSDDAVATRAKNLWKDGSSSSQIAKALNAQFRLSVTRNAVIGYISRQGLQRSEEAVAASQRLTGGNGRPKPKKVAPPPKIAKPKAPPPPSADTLVPLAGSLMALPHGCCKWPYGDSDFRFCGRPAGEGASYCASHALVATAPRLPSGKRPTAPELIRGLRRYL